MTSLRKKYDRPKVIPEELGINPTLPTLDKMGDIHKVDVDTLLSYLVMDSNINTHENQRIYVAMRSLIDSHPDKEKLESKKVKLEAIGYSLN
ncbi:hypothetical protein Tco_0813119 [Tanacetum coccineum]